MKTKITVAIGLAWFLGFACVAQTQQNSKSIPLQLSDRLQAEILKRSQQDPFENLHLVRFPLSEQEALELLCTYTGMIYVGLSLSGVNVDTADAQGRMDLTLFHTWSDSLDLKAQVNRYCDKTKAQEPVANEEMVRCSPNPNLCNLHF
jgi:hypothetical protein